MQEGKIYLSIIFIKIEFYMFQRLQIQSDSLLATCLFFRTITPSVTSTPSTITQSARSTTTEKTSSSSNTLTRMTNPTTFSSVTYSSFTSTVHSSIPTISSTAEADSVSTSTSSDLGTANESVVNSVVWKIPPPPLPSPGGK